MNKVRIITDSNSGILQSEADKLGIFVIPMPFTIDGTEYLEDINITQEQFYEFLEQNADVKTSQPSQYYLEELWQNELKDYDEIIYIPMSGGLSATCRNAQNYAAKFDGKVVVVDNKRISVNLKESVLEAIELSNQGKSANQIKEYLEKTSNICSTYIAVGTLKYLKKGGRISPATAALGSMLNAKPILGSRGGNFDKLGIVLTTSQAKKKIISKLKQELETEFKEYYNKGLMCISVAHTSNEKEAIKFKEDILKEFPDLTFEYICPLPLSVSCHIGPGTIGASIYINSFIKKPSK